MATRSPRPSRRRRLQLPRGDAERIVLTLFDLVNHLQRRGEQLAATVGLTTQQWLVLLQIAGDPNFPGARATETAPLASEIARDRAVTRATVSAVVTALKRRGLVAEAIDGSDARRRRLALTDAGAATVQAVQPGRLLANQRLFAALDRASRARLLRDLRGCLDGLVDGHEDAQLAAARRRLAAARPVRRGRSPSRA